MRIPVAQSLPQDPKVWIGMLVLMVTWFLACSKSANNLARIAILLSGGFASVYLITQGRASNQQTCLIAGGFLVVVGFSRILGVPLGRFGRLEMVEENFDYPYRWWIVLAGIILLAIGTELWTLAGLSFHLS